jgi:hypothetical protein
MVQQQRICVSKASRNASITTLYVLLLVVLPEGGPERAAGHPASTVSDHGGGRGTPVRMSTTVHQRVMRMVRSFSEELLNILGYGLGVCRARVPIRHLSPQCQIEKHRRGSIIVQECASASGRTTSGGSKGSETKQRVTTFPSLSTSTFSKFHQTSLVILQFGELFFKYFHKGSVSSPHPFTFTCSAKIILRSQIWSEFLQKQHLVK